jgi:hypothetical protein
LLIYDYDLNCTMYTAIKISYYSQIIFVELCMFHNMKHLYKFRAHSRGFPLCFATGAFTFSNTAEADSSGSAPDLCSV